MRFLFLILILLFLGCNSTTNPQNNTNYNYLEDEIEKVIDGDTVYLGNLGLSRLAYIDAPESKYSYKMQEQANKCADGNVSLIKLLGTNSYQYLKTLLNKKFYYIDLLGTDIYNRNLIDIIDNHSINLEMVKNGYAVAFFRYLDKDNYLKYKEAMEYAQKNQLGLWKKYYLIMECIVELDK